MYAAAHKPLRVLTLGFSCFIASTGPQGSYKVVVEVEQLQQRHQEGNTGIILGSHDAVMVAGANKQVPCWEEIQCEAWMHPFVR